MAKLLAEVGSATLVEGWKGHCTSLAGLSAYLARLTLTLQTTCREGVWPRQGGRRGRARALRMIYPAARGCSTEPTNDRAVRVSVREQAIFAIRPKAQAQRWRSSNIGYVRLVPEPR